MASKSPRHQPLKSYPMTASPLRLFCILAAYKEYEPRSWHMPWTSIKTFSIDLDNNTKDCNGKGFIHGQKVQPQRLNTIPLQDEKVFPQCKSVHRAKNDEKLYPQHGDLKSAMFKRPCHSGQAVLRTRRTELTRQGDYNGMKVLDVEEIEIESANESLNEALLNEELVEKMKKESRQAEARRLAAREARRAKRQKKEASL